MMLRAKVRGNSILPLMFTDQDLLPPLPLHHLSSSSSSSSIYIFMMCDWAEF